MADVTKPSCKPGIVYLSRIPPSMNPLKLRKLLSQYGEVGRLFLQPEDPAARKKRKKSGGNMRKQFTEGWVEYKDKQIAKSVAQTLNNNIMGGKKRNFHHDDIWNIKYLPKFKWTHISEKLAYEKAVREQRMRTEIAQVKRETNAYLENVDTGKVINAIEKKKKRKLEATMGEEMEVSRAKVSKKFYQKTVIQESEKKEGTSTLNRNLLSKILTSG